MKRVSRIKRIRGYVLFKDFTWPADLSDFKRYNLIYGWNWSGKTLMSRIFDCLQKGHSPECGDILIGLSEGEDVRREDFNAAQQQLMVRVFNRDFVEQNVFGTERPVGPIFVLGEKSIEKQKELEEIRAHLARKQSELGKKQSERQTKQTEVNRFCTESARLVRETLRSGGSEDDYANYERPNFIRLADSMLKESDKSLVIEQAQKDRLLEMIRAERRSSVDPLSFLFRPGEVLFHKSKELCERSVVSSVIDDLRNQPDLNAWVGDGLKLHQKHGTVKCLFCNQPLPKERLQALEAHFSDQYTQLVNELDLHLNEVKEVHEGAKELSLLDDERFYPDLREKYKKRSAILDNEKEKYIHALEALSRILKKKRSNPFENYQKQIAFSPFKDDAVSHVNEIIEEHNRKVQNHDIEVREAKEKIELSIVAEKLAGYERLNRELEELDQHIDTLEEEIKNVEDRRKTLESSLVEHRRPAEELTKDLAAYLGHSELQFEVLETGYRIVRNDAPAQLLSEGEKTAVALLYFLKTLEDKDFDKPNGIIVIDDPISSLDSNALYHAFGFIKSRVKDAGQLFVLTHNFLFFRQVRNWFSYLPKRGSDVRYYMLEVLNDEAGRSSRLAKLDPLLKDYESEYHYLFSLVYQASQANAQARGLAQYHYLPNVTRRLMEAFLEFKVPGKESLYTRLEKIQFDAAKKTRILRFCDTHSHSKVIDEAEHEPVILGEGIPVARDVMDMIREVDFSHFNRMTHLVGGQAENGEN